ncbi:hypothetical protein [Paraburkholderia franconis]|uniref:hypothetical protein n=1 Tax=Paraburkholderia franconis TaxID=2654983 RepID=UPI00187B23DD|nr:hypothetical protein [Paraburkholderia franconis]
MRSISIVALSSAQNIEQMLGDHRTDRVNRIVSRQSFFRKAMHGLDHRFEIHRKLVFNDGVERGMCGDIRKLDVCRAIPRFDQNNALLFVEFEPQPRFGE